MPKSSWVVIGLALVLVTLFVGCGDTAKTPPPNAGGMGEGPPMPAGEKSPLMANDASEAEKLGHGPGRGMTPEGARKQLEGGGPPGGGAPSGPPGAPR
jgi:hypothetical protein